ncbi:MAG: hypothetical protein ACOCVF_02015 [bacterium]
MILQRALKEKNRLVSRINKLKTKIQRKNSYREGDPTPDQFKVHDLMRELFENLEKLNTLKFVINEANREIQPYIYQISEYKSLIQFLQNISVQEGVVDNYNGNSVVYKTQMNELEINEMVENFENKIDLLQEEIDRYNYTTDIPWGDEPRDDKNEPDESQKNDSAQ